MGRGRRVQGKGRARPRPLTALLGRDGLVSEVASQLVEHRCITLTGAPGIGKSRVALAVAARFDETRWLDVRELDADATYASLARLGTGSASRLVLLDGADHGAQRLGPLLGAWLSESDGRLLVTSSTSLGIPGERVVEVPPLATPPRGASPEEIVGSSAGALLVARAQERSAGVRPTASDAGAWVAILEGLDGHPLAIELAAGPLALLGVEACRDALPRRMTELLASATGAGAAGLRGAIEPALERLTPPERALLAACAIFAGPFDREALEEMASDAVEGRAGRDLWALLGRLVRASLVRALPREATARPRYSMIAPVRAVVEERASGGRRASGLIERHARYFSALGEDLARRLQTTEDDEAQQRLGEVEPELRRVVARVLGDEASPVRASPLPIELAARALLALEPLALRRGPFDAYGDLLVRTTTRLGDASPPDLRARLAMARARIALARGTLTESAELFDQARRAARGADRPDLEGMCLTRLGVLASYVQGEQEAARLFDAARRTLARCDVPYLEGNLLVDRASAESRRGREEEAVTLRVRAIALYQRAGHRRRAAVTRGYLGTSYLALGRTWEARAALVDALGELEGSEDPRTEHQLRGYLGSAELALGDVDHARALLEAAAAGHHALGDRWSEAYTRGALGDVALASGDARAALKAYRFALAQFTTLAEPAYAAIYGASLAAAEVALGREEEAAAHLQDAEAGAAASRVPTAVGCVALFGGLLDVAQATRERGARRTRLHERAERRLAQHASPRRARPPTHHELFAARLLGRSLAALTAKEAPAPATGAARARRSQLLLAGEQRSRLRVGPDVGWIRIDGGAAVDLSRRKPLRLLLAALIEAHASSPGQPVPRDALFAAAWPGQARTRHESAMNRVYVNLVRLRAIGLRDLVWSRDDGVLLDPGVQIET